MIIFLKFSPRANRLLLGSKEVIQGLLGGLEVWFGLRPVGGKKNDREEENNARQRRLPQHWGAKLSAAVWEWCDQRLLEGRAWRVAEVPSVKGKTSPLQMEYETSPALSVYWSRFQTFYLRQNHQVMGRFAQCLWAGVQTRMYAAHLSDIVVARRIHVLKINATSLLCSMAQLTVVIQMNVKWRRFVWLCWRGSFLFRCIFD